MKKIKLLITLTCSFFTSLSVMQANGSYSLGNYAEIGTAALRGPLAALSHHNHGKYTKTTKVIHALTDAVRLTNEILSLINHSDDIIPSSCVWIAFDLANLHIDLFEKDEQSSSDDLINWGTEQTEIINTLVIKVSQTCFLPLTEGLTAFYRAMNIAQTTQDLLLRRQEQAFCSLSRAISIFLNHQHSKPAIALLLAALTETILALSNYPKIGVAPERGVIPNEQNQVLNNNIDLENNQQQEELPHQQQEINVHNNDQEELFFYDAPDHFEDELPPPDGNSAEHVIIDNQQDSNAGEEEFIFYDTLDHFEDELPPGSDNPKQNNQINNDNSNQYS